MSARTIKITVSATYGSNDVAVEMPVNLDDKKFDKAKLLKVVGGYCDAIVKTIDGDSDFNPPDTSKPCCEGFSKWFNGLTDKASAKFCAICGKEITDERRGNIF